MAESSKEFDVIIFGATGHVGQYVVEEFANSTKHISIKWAVAGRNVEKLKKSLQHVQQYLEGVDILHVPIIKADINDQKSLLDMCKAAKVILNCVGPYKFYGEPVVLACITSGTHLVDLSVEISYLEVTQANYFVAARDKGIYIVQASGFISAISDCGTMLMKKNFPGDLKSVEYYVNLGTGPFGWKATVTSLITYVASLTDFFKISHNDKILKEKVFTKEWIQSKYELPFRLPTIFYSDSDFVRGLCVTFIGPDFSVVKRSQLFRHQYLNGGRPVEFSAYIKVTVLFLLYIFYSALLCLFLSMFTFGRYLIAKFPSLITCGQFSKNGPSRKQVEENSVKTTFIGEGWKCKLSEKTDQHATEPDTKLKLTITGPEPAYLFTSMCMVHAGLVILQESEKMPLVGGVLTPGVAFENTTYLKRLEQRGINFTFENI